MSWDRSLGRSALRMQLRSCLRVPAVAAPMFLVSGVDLVVASCRAGIIGAFPTLNARTPAILAEWLTRIERETQGGAPYAANIILDKSNVRLEEDIAVTVEHRSPIVIASVGRPDRLLPPVHGYGGIVFADVATLRHAKNAASAGVDGLVLLTAGAGGNAGWLNPFAFLAAVREFFDGPIAIAGCLSHGRELRALEVLGADFGYMGTAFIAASESMAPLEHKAAVVNADIDGVVLTDKLTGMKANFLRQRLFEAGVMNADGHIREGAFADVYSWKNVWSAGQGVGQIRAQESVADIVQKLLSEYEAQCR